MPLYECVFIARQDISAPQVEALVEAFSGVITEQGGTVVKQEYWGLRNLAYRIKKNRKGHYVMFNLDSPPAAVHEMERQMHLNEDVLRFLTLRIDEVEEGPSVVMQNRDRGDRDRGDRGDRPRRDRGDRGDRGDRPRRDADQGESRETSPGAA